MFYMEHTIYDHYFIYDLGLYQFQESFQINKEG